MLSQLSKIEMDRVDRQVVVYMSKPHSSLATAVLHA